VDKYIAIIVLGVIAVLAMFKLPSEAINIVIPVITCIGGFVTGQGMDKKIKKKEVE